MVMAPANTGKANKSKIAVMRTDQTNKGIFSKNMDGVRILMIVEMKFTAPRIEEAPAIWSEKIVKSTAAPLWAK
jgi:hypothetical protein